MSEDAITMLTSEHNQLQDLFKRVSQPDEDRPKVLKELMQTMASHVAVEKQMVVPVLKDHVTGGADMCGELEEMHDRVEHILVLLERRKVNSPDVPDLLNDLLQLTDRHIAHANGEVLPALGQGLSSEQLEELGRRMASDERHMLTHSHPTIPDAGPVAAVARKAAEVVDRVRDRSTDIGRTAS